MGGGNLRSGPHGQDLRRGADLEPIRCSRGPRTTFGVIQNRVARCVPLAEYSRRIAVHIAWFFTISGIDTGACVAVIRAGAGPAAVASDSADADRRACFDRSSIQTMIDIIIRILGAAADAAGISTHI